ADRRGRYAEVLRDHRRRLPFHRGAPERLPCPVLEFGADQAEDIPIDRLDVEPPFDVVHGGRREAPGVRHEQGAPIEIGPPRPPAPPPPEQRQPLVPRDPAQPAWERVSLPLPPEVLQAEEGRLEHLLDDVVDLLTPDAPSATPVAQERRVEPHQSLPGF